MFKLGMPKYLCGPRISFGAEMSSASLDKDRRPSLQFQELRRSGKPETRTAIEAPGPESRRAK